MRCPKCQYLGFEPSPRCKNCGYDFSFSGDDVGSLALLPVEGDAEPARDVDLAMLDTAPTPAVSEARGFDLDELLAHGRSDSVLARSATASAVATPPPTDILKLLDEEVAAVKERQLPDLSALATPPPPRPDPEFKVPDVFLAPTPAVTVRAVNPDPIPEPVRVAAPPLSVRMATPEPTPVPPPVIAPVSIPEPAPVVAVKPVAQAAPVAPAPAPKMAEPAPVTTELPLFMQGMSDVASSRAAAAPVVDPVIAPPAAPVEEVDDRPLVQVPTSPRAPLSVRRTTPDPARLRAKYARPAAPPESQPAGDLLRAIDEPAMPVAEAPAPAAAAVTTARLSAQPTPESLPAGWLQGVSAGKRVGAAALDLALLLGINGIVLWLTLSVCGMSAAQAKLLPLVPLAVLFVLLDGGYLVLFTAACGQTIGKMAAGIRVVGTSTSAVINDRIGVGQSVARAIGAIISCLPLGIGFLVGLGGDGRALHDRVAHTRVVRA